MSEISEAVGEAVEKSKESRLNALIAMFVAITATFLALCNVKDGNIVQAMAMAQANSVDQWAYYQAKGTKQNLAESTMEQMRLARDTTPNLTPEARKQFDDKIAEHAAMVKKYEKEKEEIKGAATGYQQQIDALNVHDDQFDMAEALLSVGIALFGITALTQKRALLVVALVFAGFGIFLGVAGFAKMNVHPELLAKLLG
jgi:hypothetical protein